MINKVILINVFFLLDDKTKLSLSQTSKQIRDTVSKIPGPCRTKTQFYISISGVYNNFSEFNQAWIYYHKIIINGNNLPAVLYKLRDPQTIMLKVNIAKREGSSANFFSGIDGRLYYPGPANGYHTWEINFAWMKANIDLRRSFIILSELTNRNCGHAHNQHQASAFAREIAMALKADYRLELKSNNELVLVPPAKRDLANLVLSNTETFTLFSSLRKSHLKLSLLTGLDLMGADIKEIRLTLEMASSSAELKSCYNHECLSDLSLIMVKDFIAIIMRYPDELAIAIEMLAKSPIMVGLDQNKLQAVLDLPTVDIKASSLCNLLTNYLANQLIDFFNARLKILSNDVVSVDDSLRTIRSLKN